MSRLRFAKPEPCGAIQYVKSKVGKVDVFSYINWDLVTLFT